MAEVKWIKIATDMFEDEKIQCIESMKDGDTVICIWVKILTLAGRLNNSGLLALNDHIAYDTKLLAKSFKKSEKIVKKSIKILKSLDLLEEINGILVVKKWEKNQNIDALAKIREQARNRVAKHRAKQKLLAEEKVNEGECNVTVTHDVTLHVTPCNALEQEQEKEEELCSSSSSSISEKSIYEKFEEEFQKKLTPSEMKSIDRLVFKYGSEMVEKALTESVLKGKPTLGYITGILKNWSMSKITTLGDRLAEKETQQVNAIKRPSLPKASKGFKPSGGGKSKWGF
ncbi:phage replisome organizer N-terminal domain-containing protein [Streptococcus mitis]|uniref:DnaD domain protein n=1 Tax=Streptococcus mitis TaxID=28037 RepID=A0A1X1K5U2_STRMT|nr:phage replisome organizer N-terminal domain-containing protein [Streptococcus mitis]ORO94740.1 hypothetical protein B7698_05710 [Streptococcus mitis]